MASPAHNNINSGSNSLTDVAISQLVRMHLADPVVTTKTSLKLTLSMLPRRKSIIKRTTAPHFQIRRRSVGPGASVRRLFAPPAPAPTLAAANAARAAEENFFAELEQQRIASFVNRWFTAEYNWEPVQQHREQETNHDAEKRDDTNTTTAITATTTTTTEPQAQPCNNQ